MRIDGTSSFATLVHAAKLHAIRKVEPSHHTTAHLQAPKHCDKLTFCDDPTKRPIAFSKYLEQLNRENFTNIELPRRPLPSLAESLSRPLSERAKTPQPSATPSEPFPPARYLNAPHIGDVSPVEKRPIERKIQLIYKIQKPIPTGTTWDVFA